MVFTPKQQQAINNARGPAKQRLINQFNQQNRNTQPQNRRNNNNSRTNLQTRRIPINRNPINNGTLFTGVFAHVTAGQEAVNIFSKVFNPSEIPLLKPIAAIYEQFSFSALKFSWQPAVADNVGGLAFFACVSQHHTDPTTEAGIEALPRLSIGAVHKAINWTFAPATHANIWYNNWTANNASQPLKLIYGTNGPKSNSIGVIHFSALIKFRGQL